MFEEDLLDGEVKKKKRRVLVGLVLLLLGGTMVALPLADLLPPVPTAVSEVVLETPVSTSTGLPGTTIPGSPEATPLLQPTATVTPLPTTPSATEDASGGAGGGTLATPVASLTPTVAPLPSATLALPGELPAAGGSSFWGFGLLTLGIAAILLGLQMLRAEAHRSTPTGRGE